MKPDGSKRTCPNLLTSTSSGTPYCSAIEVNVAIVRAFVRLRQLLVDHAELASMVAELEENIASHDERIAAVFEAIRQLLQPPPTDRPTEP